MTLGLNTRQLSVTASGVSHIKLKGRAGRQQVHLSGSSNYNATAAEVHLLAPGRRAGQQLIRCLRVG